MDEAPDSYVPARMSRYGFVALAIDLVHAFRVASLPLHHRDPFDRLLIAQAQIERLPILTSDPHFARYDVETIW
jgi:PIN domain nuclease of toxin-antitoxin system